MYFDTCLLRLLILLVRMLKNGILMLYSHSDCAGT